MQFDVALRALCSGSGGGGGKKQPLRAAFVMKLNGAEYLPEYKKRHDGAPRRLSIDNGHAHGFAVLILNLWVEGVVALAPAEG